MSQRDCKTQARIASIEAEADSSWCSVPTQSKGHIQWRSATSVASSEYQTTWFQCGQIHCNRYANIATEILSEEENTSGDTLWGIRWIKSCLLHKYDLQRDEHPSEKQGKKRPGESKSCYSRCISRAPGRSKQALQSVLKMPMFSSWYSRTWQKNEINNKKINTPFFLLLFFFHTSFIKGRG